MSQTTVPRYVLRRGAPELARRLTAGLPCTVAYLGGSITQAYPDGYAWQTTAWLRTAFPQTAFTEINAGIGGTGSDLGAFRLRQDVLRYEPDVLFLEFAVNDSGSGHDIRAAMEGIVRHVHQVRPQCDVLFIYTLAQSLTDDLNNERLWPAAARHEEVAVQYGLPSINVAVDVARRLAAGKLTWEAFAADGVHPNASGHALYTDVIREAITAMLAQPIADTRWPAPLTPDPWETGDILPIDPATTFPDWTYTPLVNTGGWECFDGVLCADTPGAEAELAFSGRAVGLFYRLGPETGDLEWAVDHGPWQTARLFDDYAPMFWRPNYRVLTDALAPGAHRLRVRIAKERDPRSLGSNMQLASLLVR